MDFNALWTQISTRILNSPRDAPTTLAIPPSHVDKFVADPPGAETSFKADLDYFNVVINEMYLTQDRKWFDRIDPVVYVVAQFSYNGETQAIPVLVGPALLKDKGIPENIAKGVVFRNTSVAGPYPYRGKGLVLAVVLCEAKSDNSLKSLISVVERTSDALALSPVTGPYTKIAQAVIDGFGALVNSGGVAPLVGLRDSYGPSYGTKFRPSYFALIDAPKVKADTLWVKDNRLMRGASLATANEEYRDADFVLYSISRPDDNRRDDVDTLPFRDLWQQVQKEAASPKEEPDYKNAKLVMATLFQQIVLSPDLTEPHGDELADKYQSRMANIHERAVKGSALGARVLAVEKPEDDPAAARRLRARQSALDILNS